MSQDPPAAPPPVAAATTAPTAVDQQQPPIINDSERPVEAAPTAFNEKAEHAPTSTNNSPALAQLRSHTSSNVEKHSRNSSSSSGLIEDPADRAPQLLAASSTDTDATLNDEKAPKKKRGLFQKKDKPVDKDMGELVKPVSIRTMFRYAKPWEIGANLFGIFLACAAGATQPLMTLIFGRLTTSFTQFGMIVNSIAQDGPTPENTARLDIARAELKHDSGMNALYLMAIGIGMFVCTYIYMVIWNYTSEAQGKRIRERYLRGVLRQDIAYFDDLGAGEVATRIQSDCHLVQVGLGEKIPISCSYIATFITGFALAYARSPRLAGVLTVILPVILAFGAFMGVTVTKYTTQSLGYISKSGTLVEEVVSSIRTVHAFGTRIVLGKKFDNYIQKSRKSGLKSSMCEGIGLSAMFFTIYCAYALAFFYGAILMTQGLADAGLVINVFMSILIGSFSMAMLPPEMQAISKGQAAAAKLFETIERVPSIDSADPGGERPDQVLGHITFENVVFHYPSRPNVPIFKGLSIDFEAGKTCALVGASGSGKSTVVQLVERFYDPLAGRVTLDGHDIRDLNLKWLRQQIGLVSQEPVLFATTVRGNVEHGLIGSKWEGASDEERFELVKKACIDANAHDFISKLPEGYNTLVGERGMLLSGGQKQRVAIARAIVSDPRILLLDEATSALDGHSERVVQDALDKAAIGRTTIVIAHRLATIKDADKILVVGAGEIIESGTHNSLLEDQDGAYAKLVANQKLSQHAAKEASADVEDSDIDSDDDIVPGSPLDSRGMPILERQITGRSLASQLLDQRKIRQDAEVEKYQKVKFARLFIRLLQMNRDSWKLYAVGFTGAVASGMVYPALAILFGKAIADFQIDPVAQPELLKSTINRKSLWYFVTAILAAVAIFFQILGFSRSGWELVTKLRTKYFEATLRHDIEWFDEDDNATGKITSNISDHPQKVQGLFGVTLGSIIQSIATLVGGCIIGLAYGPLLALIGIACIPLVVSAGYIRLRVVVLKDEKNKKWYAASANMASEAAGAVRTVAALTREEDVSELYSRELETPFRTSNKVAIYSQALYAASQGMAFLVIALVFYIGALWIADGRYDTATFFTTLTATVFAAIQAGNVFMFVPDASSANASARSIFRVLDNEPEIDADATDGLILDPATVQGNLRLEKIHFRYPSRPGVRVLRNLTVDIPAGQYIALVGPSGCGKSTTIQMIERFYDPLAGMVTLDGVDIREININSYRSHIALVSQEPTLYAGTIKFNILLGAAKPMDQVTQEEIDAACKDANIYDFIMSLPDGFDTEVGGKGSQLSGGQKQRIAIARALVRNPKVLLLDEATAALDSTSERVVQQALDNASKGRSVVAIAHRLSTIQNADCIYFVSDGGVLEKGTHAELIARKGAYYELVQMQNLSKIG